ncbi:MAG: ABC transporter substrate-binding protein [Candidatus Bathyarchaeota archaeon]|nr:ABC transporter substrate-binding protein [Candidatus Bathyarchaeota archaeon]
MKLDHLRVAQSSIDIGDPHICSDSLNRNSIIDAIYEPLIQRSKPGYFVPALARTWSLEPDGLTWLFRIRDHVQFHNGDRLTARDVVASMNRIIDPSIGGAFGTQGVYASYIGDAEFSAPRPDIFKIKTREPMADLLDLLSEMPIAPENELDKLPREYTGTGPYFVSSKRRGELVLERYRGHWGKTGVADEVSFIEVPDSKTRSEMVLDRDVNIGSLIDVKDTVIHQDSERTHIKSLESSLCIIFMMNSQEGACSDKRIRQALNYGLDIEAVIKQVKNGAATRLNGYLTPHHFGYNSDTEPYPYDLDHAKSLLAEAGYVDGLKLTIDLPTRMPDEALELGEIMKTYYAKIGIDVELVSYSDRPGYAEMVRDKQIHDLCCFDSSPLSTFRVLREKIHSGFKGPWWEGYSNPEVDRLINEAQRTFDTEKRGKIYQQVFQLIHDDAPWLFLYRPTYYWAVSDKLKEWRPASTGILRLAE